MRIIAQTLYNFNELPAEIQEKIIGSWREDIENRDLEFYSNGKQV